MGGHESSRRVFAGQCLVSLASSGAERNDNIKGQSGAICFVTSAGCVYQNERRVTATSHLRDCSNGDVLVNKRRRPGASLGESVSAHSTTGIFQPWSRSRRSMTNHPSLRTSRRVLPPVVAMPPDDLKDLFFLGVAWRSSRCPTSPRSRTLFPHPYCRSRRSSRPEPRFGSQARS